MCLSLVCGIFVTATDEPHNGDCIIIVNMHLPDVHNVRTLLGCQKKNQRLMYIIPEFVQTSSGGMVMKMECSWISAESSTMAVHRRTMQPHNQESLLSTYILTSVLADRIEWCEFSSEEFYLLCFRVC